MLSQCRQRAVSERLQSAGHGVGCRCDKRPRFLSGPTDLRVDGADLTVRQIGVASVATTQGQGVFGVGPRATTSWFVPGDGDIPPMRLTSPARRVSLPRKAPRILEAPPRPCSPLETAVSLHPRSRQALRLTKRSPTPVVSQPK